MTPFNYYLAHAYAPGSNHFMLSTTERHSSFINTGTGWNVGGQPAGEASFMDSAVERGAATFVPLGNIDSHGMLNSIGNGFRNETLLKGIFAAGTWKFDFRVAATRGSAFGSGRARFRLWKSSDPIGQTNAVAFYGNPPSLGAGSVTTTNLTPSSSTVSFSMPEIRFNEEYLFLQVYWQIWSPGGDSNNNVRFRVGPSNTVSSLNTPDFIPDQDIGFVGMNDNTSNPNPLDTTITPYTGTEVLSSSPSLTLDENNSIDNIPVFDSMEMNPGAVDIQLDDGPAIEPVFDNQNITMTFSQKETSWFLGEIIF